MERKIIVLNKTGAIFGGPKDILQSEPTIAVNDMLPLAKRDVNLRVVSTGG